MPRLNSGRAALIGALVVLAACSDDSPSLPGGPPEPPDLGATGGTPSSVPTRPRFEVDLQATGSFLPGHPVQLILTVTGAAAMADAEIELVLPEVASAQASGWTDYRPLRTGRLPAAQSRRGGLGQGARTVIQEAVTFPVPGLYSVWASARARDTDSIPDVDEQGNVLLDEAHAVAYVLVDERGGRLMREMDTRVLPPAAVQGLGPLRLRTDIVPVPADLPRPPRVRDSGGSSSSLAPRMTAAPLPQTTGSQLRLVVDYWDPSASRYVPLNGAEWYLHLYNSANAYIGTRNGFLPADGSVTVGCSEAYYAELIVWAYNDRVSVGGASDFRIGQEVDRQTVYPGSDCSRGTIYTDALPVPSHVYVGLDKAMRAAQTFFGRSRARIPAVLTSNTTIPYSTYCPPGTWQGCTFGGDDYLRIQTDSTTAYGQQIWGQTGAFITTHELGHAYHEKALGGFIRYYTGCGAHSLTALATSMRCALPEGFADYFAVAVRPDETGYDYAWETNHYYRTYLLNQDGSRSEGAIAAFFYDLTDNNRWGAETHDIVQYAGSVVGNVITGCQVYEGGTWIYNNGIDHLTYCFERRVDPTVTGNTKYFPTRNPDPTSYSVASAVTNATEVRKIWRRNLYNE